jgi:plastocyanin
MNGERDAHIALVRGHKRLCLLSVALVALAALLACGCAAGTAEAPDFNDSTPLADDVYAAQPVNVTLNFQVDVEGGSTISVEGDGREWGQGPVMVEDNSTALKRSLRQGMPPGSYAVSYEVDYARGDKGEGRFSFSIDPELLSGYEDLTGRDSVTVRMLHLEFEPKDIIVSPGTTITWINEEDAGHFVNTETHPEHTYYPEMNSLELARGEEFSVTLSEPGQYDYHCSAHVPQGMRGSVVVR